MFHLLCSIYLTATTSKAERSLHVYVQDFCPCISLRDYYNRFTLRAIVESEMELPETSSQISKEAAWPSDLAIWQRCVLGPLRRSRLQNSRFFLKINKEIGKAWRKSLKREFLCFQPRPTPFVWLLARTWIHKNTDCFAVYWRSELWLATLVSRSSWIQVRVNSQPVCLLPVGVFNAVKRCTFTINKHIRSLLIYVFFLCIWIL